ncbi:uncharacterized protein LOC130724946 [Lotus japonicus]|uniref:uncharacterized protein LOC130724946 n=1 Tax=Lotus japonicus TaxID=34305 RepID=UPI00258E8EC2|nr:uncharacterized protein LOC130724946 [Lotus japonicus]
MDRLTPPPPPPPPPPPSPTPPLPSPPSSPEQQRTLVNSPPALGEETQAPQAPISSQDWRRLIRSVDDIHQRNDYLQEQLEYYHFEQQDEGEREAEAVAEFEPFSAVVREVAIPDNMNNIFLETYNGKADPKEHLLYFNMKMVISDASDAVKCRMFPAIFKGTAMAWVTTLPRGSIMNFRDFSSKFLVQFSASKTKQVTIEDLYNVRQSEGETLKQYVKRFSAASVKIEESEPNVCARAFKNGLQPGKLNRKLSRKPARSMAEVRARANTYILYEEYDAFKRRRAKVEKDGNKRDASPENKPSKERTEGSKRRDRKVRASEKVPREPLYPKKENFERRRPWHQADSRWREEPGKSLSVHLTELLRENEIEIERLIRASRSQLSDHGDRWSGERQRGNRYNRACQQDDRKREDRRRTPNDDKKETLATQKKGAEETFNKDLEPPVGTINTIAGGFGGGRESTSARRRHVRAVTSVQQYETPFGFQHPDIVISSADFDGIKTHKDDPVVVMIRIKASMCDEFFWIREALLTGINGDAFD